ncbi:protein phosphatase 2C domain-containing protein [Alicyclobacillus sp. ALC3]|uniref:protein phosphatase 2C domain-containing protein n=1 Tax=Alicyclobacillus sp. ALC3 TaxID=2796143 RepID=UPI0023784CE5|nr:protein phosphatase 2C domain-containing protein [Alicyclobacillus sp. ALC3]WDL95639.1 protein phosphatase 2C domain-containing protein [Alicyclobacillus sp. ALC3]
MSGNSVAEIKWAGAMETLIDQPTVKFSGPVVLGIYGGNSSTGAHKNEDGALIWSDTDADWEFAVILDGHNTSESVQLVLNHFALCKSDIMEILNSATPDVFQHLHEYIRESLCTLDTSSVQGECSCLTFARRGGYLWWLNVGDCALYLLNEDYARLGQYAVNQRSFFEWVGQVNTFNQPIPCYSAGVKSLRQGRNIILALTDGVLEFKDSPFASPKHVYDMMFSSEDIGIQVRELLDVIHTSQGRDSATVIAWNRRCNDVGQVPSDV